MRRELYMNEVRQAPDIYSYTTIPDKLKNQVFHIWSNFFQQQFVHDSERENIYKQICQILSEETGQKELIDKTVIKISKEREAELFFDITKEIEVNLTQIQITFRLMNLLQQQKQRNIFPSFKFDYSAEQAIEDLNNRFRQHGIGYQYTNGRIIKISNDILHEQIIKQVLVLLSGKDFTAINEDFLDAHEHFRMQRFDDCLNDCLKAFESTMKIVCDLKGWQYPENATAKPLIKVILDNNFFPPYYESQLNALKLLMESSIPTIRNKNSGHGAGNKPVIITEALASYMLYMTGATIRFLAETYYTIL